MYILFYFKTVPTAQPWHRQHWAYLLLCGIERIAVRSMTSDLCKKCNLNGYTSTNLDLHKLLIMALRIKFSCNSMQFNSTTGKPSSGFKWCVMALWKCLHYNIYYQMKFFAIEIICAFIYLLNKCECQTFITKVECTDDCA